VEFIAPVVQLGGSIAARTEATRVQRDAQNGDSARAPTLNWHPDVTYHNILSSGTTGFFFQEF